MSEANELWKGDYKEYDKFLHSMPEGHKNYSNEDIGELFGVYARLLVHLEAFFSIL